MNYFPYTVCFYDNLWTFFLNICEPFYFFIFKYFELFSYICVFYICQVVSFYLFLKYNFLNLELVTCSPALIIILTNQATDFELGTYIPLLLTNHYKESFQTRGITWDWVNVGKEKIKKYSFGEAKELCKEGFHVSCN